MSDTPSPENRATRVMSPPERSFPLIAVFHLATLWASMVACVDGKLLRDALGRTNDSPGFAVGLAVSAALGGAVLGAAIGLGQLRRWRGALVGGAIGGLYGLAILGVFVAPASLARGMAAAGVLLITTVTVRAHSS